MEKLRAAMAVANITPDRDEYLEGYEPHGELSLARCPQDHTSELKARVLLLDNGTDRLLLVNMELLFADDHQYATVSADFTAKAAKLCGATPSQVLFSNTHTHHAPRQLTELAEEKLLRAVAQAAETLKPAVLRVSRGHTTCGVSRSRDYGIDVTRAYDDELTVLRVDNQNGKPLGLVFNVPIHNTLYGHGPDLKKNRHLLNCEFTGYACRYLEETIGQDFVAMHMNGFYGNSGPLYKGEYYAPNLEELKNAGSVLGKEVEDLWSNAGVPVAPGPVSTAFLEDSLTTRQDSRAFSPCFGDFEKEPVRIHAGAFGELATVAVNYEPFSMLGARLKAEAPFQCVLPAAGMGWRGYIPTKQTWLAHRKQKEVECEPIKSPLTIDAEETFYEMLLQTVCALKQVTVSRTPATRQACHMEGKEAVYDFCFDSPIRADKLVLDFGQSLRTDCASDFTLLAGKVAVTTENFSSGYWGMFLDAEPITQVQLRVKSRYLYGKLEIDRLSPTLTAIRYDRKEDKK